MRDAASGEAELLTAALDAGAHVVLEGPPGTGKSTLLRAVAGSRDVPFFLVEGNAELTPARLVGHFDPAQVLARGYRPEIFVDGPLVDGAARRRAALRRGDQPGPRGDAQRPDHGDVRGRAERAAARGHARPGPGFRLVAAMNPFDAVGTARISSAIYDRTCRIAMGYQSAATEAAIVQLRGAEVDPAWQASVVELVRRTRDHPDVRVGSSVRGAIDLVGIAGRLGAARGVAADRLAGRPGRGARRAVRPDPAARVAAPARPRTSSASSTMAVFGPPPSDGRSPSRRSAAGGSLSPPSAGTDTGADRRSQAARPHGRPRPARPARGLRRGLAGGRASWTRTRWPG